MFLLKILIATDVSIKGLKACLLKHSSKTTPLHYSNNDEDKITAVRSKLALKYVMHESVHATR